MNTTVLAQQVGSNDIYTQLKVNMQAKYMRDPVQTEWRRLLRRVRQHGVLETVNHMLDLAKEGYPLWYFYLMGNLLLKRKEFAAVEHLYLRLSRLGRRDMFLDENEGKRLWCVGDRRGAIKFVTRRARLRPHSCLYSLLSALHRINGNDRMDKKCLKIAAALAETELVPKKNYSKESETRSGR